MLQTIRSNNFYTILADESSDVTKLEQLSFTVRSCDEHYNVKDFVGIFECSNGISADALITYITDMLLRCNLDPHKIVGIGFDGASTMKSVAAKLKTIYGVQASYFHCLAHCNELIVKDAHEISSMLSDSLGICQTLYALIGAYPKRIALLEGIQKDAQYEVESEDYKILRLRSLSVTRWTTRAKVAYVVLTKNKDLKVALSTLAKDSTTTAEVRAKVKGILQQLACLKKMFGLQATYELVGLLENLSVQLQSAGLTADVACFCIKNVSERLTELRSDIEFERILKSILLLPGIKEQLEQDSEQAPASRSTRNRKIPRALNNANVVITEQLTLGGAINRPKNKENMLLHLKQEFFEAIDAMIKSLDERFEQEGMQIVAGIEKCLLAASNRKNALSASALQLLQQIPYIDVLVLADELLGLPTVIGMYNATSDVKIKEITKVTTLCDIFNSTPAAKVANPQIHKLLRLYCTMPLTTASCERSFSVMRRLKTWVRSRSGQNHLNNIMFAHIQKDAMDNINMENVANDFINANETRKLYFGC